MIYLPIEPTESLTQGAVNHSDVYAIEKAMTANSLTPDIPAQLGNDGVDSMMVRDPDGNMVCFHGPQPE